MARKTKLSPEPEHFSQQVLFGDALKSLPGTAGQYLTKAMDREFVAFEEKLLAKGWEVLGDGRMRTGFTHPNIGCVLKVSHNTLGVKANLTELHYADLGDEITVIFPWAGDLAPTTVPIPRVFGHVRVGLLSILCVEWTQRVAYDDAMDLANEFPWINRVDLDDDGPQVGYTKSGRLVCFDWCTF